VLFPCSHPATPSDSLSLAHCGPSVMNHTRAPSPLATARPKNSSSSISSQHQQSSASQGLPQMPSSSKPRGTTPSTSRSPQQPQPNETRPGRAPSKDSLKQKMAKVAEEPSRPSKADEVSSEVPTWTMQQRGRPRLTTPPPQQQLQVLRSDFDSLRQHLTCKICDRLLYQPYTIACGHTYCYSVSTHNLGLPACLPRHSC